MKNYYDEDFDLATKITPEYTTNWDDITEFVEIEMDDGEEMSAVNKFLSKPGVFRL